MRRKPAIKASYSASLFVAEKARRNDCSSTYPVGDCNITPIPDPCHDEAPLTCSTHFSTRETPVLSSGGSSIRKSTSTSDLTHVRFLYSMSYSLSSMAHFSSQPDWLGL